MRVGGMQVLGGRMQVLEGMQALGYLPPVRRGFESEFAIPRSKPHVSKSLISCEYDVHFSMAARIAVQLYWSKRTPFASADRSVGSV